MNTIKEDEEFIRELKELYRKHKKVIDTDDYIFIKDVKTDEEINNNIERIGEWHASWHNKSRSNPPRLHK